jgi:hypothetical protein
MTRQTLETGADPFDGDLEAARHRLCDLADSACEVLNVRLLNILSFHLAVYIDKDAGGSVFTDRMMAEVAAERQRYVSAKAKKAGRLKGK